MIYIVYYLILCTTTWENIIQTSYTLHVIISSLSISWWPCCWYPWQPFWLQPSSSQALLMESLASEVTGGCESLASEVTGGCSCRGLKCSSCQMTTALTSSVAGTTFKGRSCCCFWGGSVCTFIFMDFLASDNVGGSSKGAEFTSDVEGFGFVVSAAKKWKIVPHVSKYISNV